MRSRLSAQIGDTSGRSRWFLAAWPFRLVPEGAGRRERLAVSDTAKKAVIPRWANPCLGLPNVLAARVALAHPLEPLREGDP